MILLATADPRPAAREQAVALISSGFDWGRFIERTIQHDVYPLVRRNLGRLGLQGIPEDVFRRLDGLHAATALRNERFAEELVQVLRDLHRARIPAIPLKGIPLAEALYGGLALRVCEDIDILVPRAAVKEAFGLLLAGGYGAPFKETFFAELFLETRIEYALTSKDFGMPHYVELHWGILYGAPFDGDAAEELWAAAPQASFREAPCFSLSPEWRLLFLAAHAARHQWYGLKWLADLHEVCRIGGFDWDKVLTTADRHRWTHWLHITFSILKRLFQTPVPGNLLLDRLPPWVQVFPAAPPLEPWRNFFFPVHLLERPADKARFVLRLVLTPGIEERNLVRLPRVLVPLYYPIRILRIILRWGWRLAREWRPRRSPA